MLLLLLTASGAAESPVALKLSDLPEPPEHLRTLIDRTPITWESGDRKEGNPTDGRLTMAGETKYDVRYSYRCSKRWSTDSGGSKLRVTVRFAEILWKPTHRIWIKNRPPDHQFWTNRIVLHELDHLQISSDPRHGDRFKQRLRDESKIVHDVANGEAVNQKYVEKVVSDHVERIFRDHTDLIEIRYKELDRVTVHGRFKVPKDSPIAKLLERTAEPPSQSPSGL